MSIFIDLNKIRGIFVDIDSLPKSVDDDWDEICNRTKLMFFSNSDFQRLDLLKDKYINSLVYKKSPYGFLSKMNILEMLDIISLESYEVILLSSNIEKLISIRELPISTIEYIVDDNPEKNYLAALSDYRIRNLEHLKRILDLSSIGYFAEKKSIIYNYGDMLDNKTGNMIALEKKLEDNIIYYYIGGRYFNREDKRHKYHQLSNRLLNFKKEPIKQEVLFTAIYKKMVEFINNEIINIDCITRIPPRPNASDDRFKNIIVELCKDGHYLNCCDNLVCLKDFKKQKFLNSEDREKNIKDAFKVLNIDFKNKHVVILDDILTSGATSREAARVVYEKGAMRVSIVVIAINQYNNISLNQYLKPINCNCGGEQILKINGKNNAGFFGCTNNSNYDIRCFKTMNYFDGINLFNFANKISEDTDDEEEIIDEW